MGSVNVKTALIEERLSSLKTKIKNTASACGRDADDIYLLAVSKRQSIEKIEMAIECGQRHFAENQIQEALVKIHALQKNQALVWHFIGTVQSNKTKLIAENFNWLHSLESLKHAKRLHEQRASLAPLNVCIQVNVDAEASKSGLKWPEVFAFAESLKAFSNLKLRGLMCIPLKENSRAAFLKLQEMFNEMNVQGFSVDTLSMGMSADFEQAIQCGSTMLRVGTALFGERDKSS